MNDFKLFFSTSPLEVFANFLIWQYKVLKNLNTKKKWKFTKKKLKSAKPAQVMKTDFWTYPEWKPCPQTAQGSLPSLRPLPSGGSAFL